MTVVKQTLLIVAIVLAWQRRGFGEERRYALVIGYNGPPSAAGVEAAPPLKFADDDALAFFELRRDLGDRAVVLVSPDADTRRRFPDSVDAAQPPTLAALDQAMDRLGEEMRADRRAGHTPVFSFFYSGHGVRGEDGQAALTLLDGHLTRQDLYERVLDRAPADPIHMLIDACHAEDVVRMRDGDATVVALSPEDIAAYLSQSTLDRYPHVGLAIASNSDGSAHEWDLYQSGVFTYEVISGLRGAADVNGDRRIEYSELAAFLSAANREVQDPRARLHTIVRPPQTAPRSPMADLWQGKGTARLIKIPAAAEALFIEDGLGRRLAEGRPEVGFFMSVTLPASRSLFVRRGDSEAEMVLRPGTDLDFATLAFRERPSRPRGAVEQSLRAGLFLTQFGPAYYRGYIDGLDTNHDGTAVPVSPAPAAPAALVEAHLPPPNVKRDLRVRAPLIGAAVALLSSSIVFAGLSISAWHDNQSSVERGSADASDRFRRDTALAAGFFLSGALCAGAAALLSGNR